jgi:hypothetical protein
MTGLMYPTRTLRPGLLEFNPSGIKEGGHDYTRTLEFNPSGIKEGGSDYNDRSRKEPKFHKDN